MASFPVLQVQINQIDHCLAPPGQLDNCDSLPVVPVIRIYGSSSTGKKCCVHVHQVYPYFFVEYIGKMRIQSVNRYITKLTHSLNHAIALSLKKDISFRPQFVRAIVFVKGIHFYGFHSSYSPFLKVYIADPTFLNRAVTIMRSGTVMGTHFRVFESHLSFTLQFMSDFGLYGCGWLDLSQVYQRGSDAEDDDEPQPGNWGFRRSSYFCQTRLPLEVDVAGYHILNRHQLVPRNLHHNLVIPAPILPPEPLVLSVRELWEDERNRRRARGLNPSPDMPIDPSESSRSSRGEWVLEARWWEDIRNRIENEREKIKPPEPDNDWETLVMTTFESVEALWEESWRTWKPALSIHEPDAESESMDIDVDDSLISDEHLSQLVEREAEWEKSLDHDMPSEEDARDLDLLPGEDEQSPRSNINSGPGDVSPIRFAMSRLMTNIQIILLRSSPSNSLGDVFSSNIPTSPSQHELVFSRNAESTSLDRFSDAISRRAMAMTTQMPKTINMNRYVYASAPPSISELLGPLLNSVDGIPYKIYRRPFFSNTSDVPTRPREYGGILHLLKGSEESLENLNDWEEHDIGFSSHKDVFVSPSMSYSNGWEYSGTPPSIRQAKIYLASEEDRAQIDGPTQANIYGLKSAPGATGPTVAFREKQRMTIFALEVFAPSPKGPSPELNEIVAAFYSLQGTDSSPLSSGMVIVEPVSIPKPRSRNDQVDVVSSELALLNQIVDVVVDIDPDILVGWEIQAASWGYLNERGRQYGLDIADLISRAPTKRRGGVDQWGMRHTSTFQVGGRHVLNLVRIMRVELTLNIYTFENVVFHVLKRRSQEFFFITIGSSFIPRTARYGPATLMEWYQDSIPGHTATVLRYFSSRTTMVLEVLEETEVVTKTAEFARVFGVDFFSVISRGSQFKVESFMFRIAKPESFVLLSPSKHDVGRMNAAEAMPLIMEPLSAFYTSPVVVLDFQSLYPSIMIANNYCYSTFLGRVNEFQGRQKFGVTDLDLRPGLVETLRDHINVSPTGMMFVKPEVRKGLLGRMLVELLETRVMVKQAMKGVQDDKTLRRILDARQLGLKYIANVTYGYTSATYSGRMPAVEIADSIVQSGRETLERAIATIHSTDKWGAKVVYGDTDSTRLLSGRTKDQAFRIGHEIAATITARSTYPAFSSPRSDMLVSNTSNPDDTEPVFDAKGIETVRRDGVPAQQKMTETCLKILFRTQDLSQVKAYCYDSWQKLLESKASIQDFIFAKEVGISLSLNSDKGPPPPGVALAARKGITDNTEAQYGERVPYVICRGLPNSRLVDRVEAPLDVLQNRHLHLDAEYYISRVLIPPLDRIFSLAGCDVRQWYIDMPKVKCVDVEVASPARFQQQPQQEEEYNLNAINIDEHFLNPQCLLCGAASDEDICDDCYSNPESTLSGLSTKIHMGEKRFLNIHRICASCAQTPLAEAVECESLDCSWLYARTKAERKLDFLLAVRILFSASSNSQSVA
ncbi:hypothetical protein B0H11DRAFT_2157036 [Mycena galericulata]|nr:hypothetical protein B0H11DRAFT_2157036 [Mycena galericulata]